MTSAKISMIKKDLSDFERNLQCLVVRYRQLREDHQKLQQQVHSLQQERTELANKIEVAKLRIENLLKRIPEVVEDPR